MSDNAPKPLPGDVLWSTCAADAYGIVLAVHDASIDIEVFSADDLITMPSDDPEWPEPEYMILDLPVGTPVILRCVQYRISVLGWECRQAWGRDDQPPVEYRGVASIVCRTPGDGCYRCTKCFVLLRRAG